MRVAFIKQREEEQERFLREQEKKGAEFIARWKDAFPSE